MQEQVLFAAALGLQLPWFMSQLDFSLENKKLVIGIDFERGSLFACPDCGKPAKAYDTKKHTWRHMDFFQHQAYLTARVPRVNCSHGCGIKRVKVPWARSNSGFTLLFEALILSYCKEMPVNKVGELMGEHDTRLWRVLHHYVDAEMAKQDYSKVTKVGMNETASRRGHSYVSFFYDMDEKKIIFATSGKDKAAVAAFETDFIAHGGKPKAVTQACSDMSPAFISGIEAHLPNADITFDKFHIVKIINEGVDAVRREDSHLTSGLIEGMNGLIQAAKNKARGYRSDRNMIAIAYLIGAKLEFRRPT